jgi:hypothetical protein
MRVSLLLFVLSTAALAGGQGWHFEAIDPHSGARTVTIDAKSFESTNDPSIFLLRNVAAHVYNNHGSAYQELTSNRALFDRKLFTLTYGPQLSKVIGLGPAAKKE